MSHADRILMGPGPGNPYPQVIKAFGRPSWAIWTRTS